MKGLLLSIIALLALSGAGPATAADGKKIASVDFMKIGQESKAGAEATASLKKLTETLGNKLKTKEAELEKLKTALEGKGKQLTPKERSAKEKEFKKKLEAYREWAMNAQKEIQTKEDEYGKNLLAGVEKVIKDYAPKNGYSLVIRKGDVVYSDGSYEVKDITEDILKIFDGGPQEAAPKK